MAMLSLSRGLPLTPPESSAGSTHGATDGCPFYRRWLCLVCLGEGGGAPISASTAGFFWEHQEEVEGGPYTGGRLWELDGAGVDQVAWSALQRLAMVACSSTNQQWEPLSFTNPPVPPPPWPAQPRKHLSYVREITSLMTFGASITGLPGWSGSTSVFIHPK